MWKPSEIYQKPELAPEVEADLKFQASELEEVFEDGQFNPEKLVALLEKQYPGTYDQKVGVKQDYTLKQHTLKVMGQYEKYFKDKPFPAGVDRNTFRLILGLHDVGKPEAVAQGDKHLQHDFTEQHIRRLFNSLHIDEKHTNLATALVSGDPLGRFINGKKGMTASDARKAIEEMADKAGIPVEEFFKLLCIYYKSDAGSYGKNAGGLTTSLDRLFNFDEKNHELNFAPDIQEKVYQLGFNFENSERPKYRYYSHGTFIEPQFNEIMKSEFRFDEYKPNLTLSPQYAFNGFLRSEIGKGAKQIKNRGKRLSPERKGDFRSEHLTEDNGVILVIEPTKEYKVHSTTEGMPNIFSTTDQKPPDDKTILTRIWTSNQKMIFTKPISQRFNDGARRPGMFLYQKLSPDGKLVRDDGITKTPGQFPASSVRMAIKKDPEFFRLFQGIGEELNNGDEVNLADYKSKLIDYFKNSKNIIRNEFKDEKGLADEAGLAELAENMVVGEYEHSLVSAMRYLYLDIQRFKGKKIMHPDPKKNKEEVKSKPAKTRTEEELKKEKEELKKRIAGRIEKIGTLKPDNKVFQGYIEIYTKALKKELNQ